MIKTCYCCCCLSYVFDNMMLHSARSFWLVCAACGFATAQRFRCDWPSLVFGDVRLVIITVLATRAGRFSNNATVSTASIDVNPDNNMSKDTVQALVS